MLRLASLPNVQKVGASCRAGDAGEVDEGFSRPGSLREASPAGDRRLTPKDVIYVFLKTAPCSTHQAKWSPFDCATSSNCRSTKLDFTVMADCSMSPATHAPDLCGTLSYGEVWWRLFPAAKARPAAQVFANSISGTPSSVYRAYARFF